MIYISHLLPDEEMREVIEKTGAGVESIEFSIAENLDRLEDSISSYKKRIRNMGAENLILHGPFLDLNPMTFDREIGRVTRFRYEQAYRAAEELGAEKIVYHSCFCPDAYLLTGWAERTAEFYQEFMRGKQGPEVVLENVFDRTWEPLVEAVRKTGMENFHLCFDAGHAGCYSSLPAEEWALRLQGETTHVHVHDNRGDGDNHLAVGEGTIDWGKICRIFRSREEITYTIECSSRKAVEKSLEKLSAFLENPGENR